MCMLMYLMVFYISETLFISLYYFFLSLDCIISINLPPSISLLPVKTYYWAPLVTLFQLLYFPTPQFPFVSLFKNIFLLKFSIWCDIFIIHSFTTLIMLSFSSLNILKMVPLKSLCVKSNIWCLSQAVSVACFLPGVHGLYVPVFMHSLQFLVENWTFYVATVSTGLPYQGLLLLLAYLFSDCFRLI